MDKIILRVLLLVGLGLIPKSVFNRNKRNQMNDWIIVFFLKGFLSSILDTFVTKQNRIKYPIRLMPEYFQINILFDYLLFPLVCVYFNQSTARSSIRGTILKSLLFSIPMTIIEVIFERKTKLITFKKNWHWYHTLVSETLILLTVRAFIGWLKKLKQ